jgi:hypothetical protein
VKAPAGWLEIADAMAPLVAGARRWLVIRPDGRILIVIASVDGGEVHVSVSRMSAEGPTHADDPDCGYVLTSLGMLGCEEDNSHRPEGSAAIRHFWKPVVGGN